jgi:hypothetical protein
MFLAPLRSLRGLSCQPIWHREEHDEPGQKRLGERNPEPAPSVAGRSRRREGHCTMNGAEEMFSVCRVPRARGRESQRSTAPPDAPNIAAEPTR